MMIPTGLVVALKVHQMTRILFSTKVTIYFMELERPSKVPVSI